MTLTPVLYEKLVNFTKGYLYEDRVYPEVGPGMSTNRAVNLAADYLVREMLSYNITAIIPTEDEKKRAIDEVNIWREEQNV